MDGTAIVVALHSHPYPGTRGIGSAWPALPVFLREELRANGAEAVEGGEGHLSALFGELPAAVSSVVGALRCAKARFGWHATLGPLPVQVVLHLQARADPPLALLDPSSRVWRLLRFDSLYATDNVRRAWTRLTAGTDLPDAVFSPGALGLHRSHASGEAPRRELFPDRVLPYLWGTAECFYCGLTTHGPAECPSRYLTIDVHGLSEVGHLPLGELPELYRRALGDPEELSRRVGVGPHAAQLRKEPLLAVSAAYFDLHRLYQLRFLLCLAFRDGSRWPGIENPGRGKVAAGSSLYLALDCLRVGKRGEAEAILSDKRRVGNAGRFFAEIGLAFLALEQDRPRDMAGTLERAAKLASSREERLYVWLLLSRCREVLGDLDGADAAADRVLEVRSDCPEGHYRRAQLLLRRGATEKALARIRSLVQGDANYFVLALMDPQLHAAGAVLEEVLGEVLDASTKGAEEVLGRARQECGQLSGWLDAEAPELSSNLGMLGRLEEQAARGGYADLLEVADRAGGLVHACSQLRKKKLHHLRADLAGERKRWECLQRTWKAYPHKMLFRLFGTLLSGSRRDLDEALSLARTESLETHRAAKALLGTARKALDDLGSMGREMAWTQGVIDFVRRFTARLLLYEAVLVPGVLLGLPILARLLGGETGPFRALGEPLVRHRTVAVLGGLLAPAIALARSARRPRPAPAPAKPA